MLISASGGVSFLAKRNRDAVAAIRALVRVGAWPPLVPSVVLASRPLAANAMTRR